MELVAQIDEGRVFEAEGMTDAKVPRHSTTTVLHRAQRGWSWMRQGEVGCEVRPPPEENCLPFLWRRGSQTLAWIRARENAGRGGHTPRVSNISTKFSSDVDEAGLGPNSENLSSRMSPYFTHFTRSWAPNVCPGLQFRNPGPRELWTKSLIHRQPQGPAWTSAF